MLESEGYRLLRQSIGQVCAQRRQFNLAEAVNEILITLGPTLRKTPYQIDSDIDPSIVLDSYPGALGQVLVNLINNALLHAFDGASQGLISVQAFATETIAASRQWSFTGRMNLWWKSTE